MNETKVETNGTNRRDFLKAAAGATALAAMAVPAVHAAGSDTIKVGIIGTGGRGTMAGENVLRAAPNVQVVAVGDVFKFRTDRCRASLMKLNGDDEIKQLGNKVDLPEDRCFVGLDCHDKVLNAGVDYVILATPPGFRPLHLQAAIAAGKHIFTEKPVAVDGTGIRKVLAAYEDSLKKKLYIAAGTQRRHQKSYLETYQRVRDGAIGDITAARCYWNGGAIWFRKRDELVKNNVPDSDLAFQLHNWYHFVWTCGDHICEQHVHNLDAVNWALGKHPTRCLGVGSRQSRAQGDPNAVGHIYDNFMVEYEYDNGVHMQSMCRQIPLTDVNLGGLKGVSEMLVGTKGTCYTDQGDAHQITGPNAWKFAGPGNAPYVQEHTDLIECIRTGKPINELKNVAESTLTAIMGRMSAYTGRAVTWDQALNSKEDTFPQNLAWNMSLSTPPVAVPGTTKLV